MGKALILNNVNFTANRLATVSIADDVPCTALTLSQSTLEFSALTSSTIIATAIPENTTDDLVWESSNENVATVSNGVVTAVGVGSATITATCGDVIATCNVSVSVILYSEDFEYILHRSASGTDISAGKDYVGSYDGGTGADSTIMLLSDTATQYKALSGTNAEYDGKYPIKIPPNTATIEITGTSTNILYLTRCNYINSTLQPTYNVSGKGSKAVSDIITLNGLSAANHCSYTVPTDVSGLDSIVITIRFTASIADVPTGVKIEFLPAA